MKKKELCTLLEDRFADLFGWVEANSELPFHKRSKDDKWSIAEHLDHLVRSTAPLNAVMKMPKEALKESFGLCNRDERSEQRVIDKYQQMLKGGVKAAGPFVPENTIDKTRPLLVEKLKREKQILLEVLDGWKEEDLSNYVIPHPVLGKMTVREMMYFTAYHTNHHTVLLKRDYNGMN